MIDVKLNGCKSFVDDSTMNLYLDKVEKAFDTLMGGKGAGSDYLGWLDLPSRTLDSDIVAQCDRIVQRWSKNIDVVVVIGIGGSYLGAKSFIEAVSHTFDVQLRNYRPQIVYAGHNMTEIYLADLLDFIKQKSVAAVVVSKSGTTTEPAVAFRLIRNHIEGRYGKEEARNRIVAITDSSKGALKSMSDKEGYTTLVIPDNVGGRYSVFTSAGLLPIALAGHDMKDFLEGARAMERKCKVWDRNNPAVQYAAVRNALYMSGRKIEVLSNFNPRLVMFGEWWKQLFGESEGKDGKGLFPVTMTFTTDLHSLGQYMQQGERIMFETVLSIRQSNRTIVLATEQENLDGLNYLSGKTIGECNKKAELATIQAHVEGGVPCAVIEINNITEYNLGALYYFFEFACALSAYTLGVNPFDQPGVELYKRNMFTLLGKPGFVNNK